MRVQLRNPGLFLFMAAPMWVLAQGKAPEKKEAAQEGNKELSSLVELGGEGGAFSPGLEQTRGK
jgi:hypothetical protein